MAFGKKTTSSSSHDILREKQQEINRLELINQQIDDGMTEIDTYMADLVKTRETMSTQRQNNAAIISNFSKLLNPHYAEETTGAGDGETTE